MFAWLCRYIELICDSGLTLCPSDNKSADCSCCQAGVSVNACDNCMRTPLSEAVEKGHMTIVEILLKAGAVADHRVTLC